MIDDGLDYIFETIPDNNTGKVSPKDVRDAFSETFSHIEKRVLFRNQTISAPTSDFKYVMLFNTQGVNKIMLAGDFGKNVANSRPTTTVDGGLDFGANWCMDTQGYKYFLKGLSDKSNNENFNRVLVQDENGDTAFSNGTNQIINAMQNATDLQKEAWRTASKKAGENYSLGSPFVSFVYPSIAKKETGDILWFYLNGNALYLNPNYVKITAIPVGVIENDVTNANEIECVSFYSPTSADFLRVGFNSDELQEGIEYNIIIRVDSPNLYKFRTNDFITAKSNLQLINLGDNNWETKTFNGNNGNVNPLLSASPTVVSSQNSSNIIPLADDGKVAFTITSKVLCTMADNFVIKLSGGVSTNNGGMNDFIGVCNDVLSNAYNTIIAGAKIHNTWITNTINNVQNNSAYGFKDIIINKFNNTITVAIFTSTGSIIATTNCSTDTSLPVRIKHVVANNSNSITKHDLKIESVYKY